MRHLALILAVIVDYNLICRVHCRDLNQEDGAWSNKYKKCFCGSYSSLPVKTGIQINPIIGDPDKIDDEPDWKRSRWHEPTYGPYEP